MADIGKRIRLRREAVGLTQEGLAEKLGYKSKTSITKIENGTNDIPQSKVVEIAQALNTTVAYLMGWDWDVVNMDLTEQESSIIDAYRENPQKRHIVNKYLGVWDNEKPIEDEHSKLNDLDLLEKYYRLDAHGKDIIDTILEKEYARCEDEYIEIAARGGKYKVKKESVVELAKHLEDEPYEKDPDLC